MTSRRPQTLPSAFGPLLHRSLARVRREPGEGASGGSLRSTQPWSTQPVHCSLIELSLWKLPPRPAPLFFRAPKVTSRRPQTLPSAFGPLLHRSLACVKREPGEEPLERAARALQPYRIEPLEAATSACASFFRALKPFPAPLAYSCIAALPASGGSLGREPLERAARLIALSLWKLPPRPAPLFFRAPKVTSRRFKPFPALLHRSLACVRREPGEEPLERAARALQPYRIEPLEAATLACASFL